MAQTILNSRLSYDVTLLSTTFITDYMPFADGDCVKVYLYLLHNLSTSAFSFRKMEETLKIDRNQSCYCLHYWENLGLLSMKMDETGTKLLELSLLPVHPKKRLTMISEDEEEMVPVSPMVTKAKEPEATPAVVSTKPEAVSETLSQAGSVQIPSLDRVGAHSYGENIEFMGLLHVLQQKDFFGRTFLPKEADLVARVFHGFSESTEAVLALMRYCLDNFSSFSDKKGNVLKKAEEVGALSLEYLKEHPDTPGKNPEQRLTHYLTTVYSLRHMTKKYYNKDDEQFVPLLYDILLPGQGAHPSTSELNTVHYWRTQFDVNSESIILAAADRTHTKAENEHELGKDFNHFAYLTGILKSWKDSGVRSIKDIDALDEKRKEEALKKREEDHRKKSGSSVSRPAIKKDYNDFPQPTYDFDKATKDFFNQIFEEV